MFRLTWESGGVAARACPPPHCSGWGLGSVRGAVLPGVLGERVPVGRGAGALRGVGEPPSLCGVGSHVTALARVVCKQKVKGHERGKSAVIAS